MKDETKLMIRFRGLIPSSRTVKNGMWKNLNPTPFLKNKNINVPIQKGSILYEWFATEERMYKND